MKNKLVVWLISLNIAAISFVTIIEFLNLPHDKQELISNGIYIIAAIIGVVIGSLVAKIFNLRSKIRQEKLALEKKQENIQTYLTNVVHDLRSPVASINMISELLEEDLICEDPTHTELITSIRKSSKTMLERICCILDNAEAEQKGAFENMTFGNPYSLIENVINKHHVLAIDKDITLNLDIPKDLPFVYFDAEALDSVFSNLISNAIKYSMPKTEVRLFCNGDKKQVTFSIKDQGLGMTREDLSKVFGRFAKLSARPTANEDSSGVGLSIVKNLVEKMDGSVKAESEGKGKGSTFSVSLSKIKSVKARQISA